MATYQELTKKYKSSKEISNELAVDILKDIQNYSKDTFISWQSYYYACEKGYQAIEELDKIKEIMNSDMEHWKKCQKINEILSKGV